MKKCDIIIPIYNAYECVEKCLESIIKNTDMKNYQIICIDDKSTDERILPLLRKYEKKYEDGTVVERVAYEVSISSLEVIDEKDGEGTQPEETAEAV